MKNKVWLDFKTKSVNEIKQEIARLENEIKKNVLWASINKNKNTCVIREIKKTLARLNTLLNKKKYEKKT